MKTVSFFAITFCLISASSVFAQQYIPLQTRVNHASVSRALSTMITAIPNTTEVQILGIGGVNDIANAQKAGGTLALGAHIDFIGGSGQTKHSLYVFFNERPANTSDTAMAVRSYLFPEVGKRNFVLGYERTWKPWGLTSDKSLIFFSEASLSKNTIANVDTSAFYSKNLTLGLRFTLSLQLPANSAGIHKQFGLDIHPYYQLVAVESKDFASRDALFQETSLPPTFHSIGLYTSVQIAELGLFANVKQILNYSSDIQNRELKGGLVVVGALISTDFFRF